MENVKTEKEIMNKEAEKKETAVEEKKNILELKVPIVFEGATVKEIDLSGLEDADAGDLISAKRMMNMNGPALDPYPERTLEYAIDLATVVLNKPEGLFRELKARDAMEFKMMVHDFLY